jgi:hypothetical protein
VKSQIADPSWDKRAVSMRGVENCRADWEKWDVRSWGQAHLQNEKTKKNQI